MTDVKYIMLIAVAWLIMENKKLVTVVMTEPLTVAQWMKKALLQESPQLIELVKNEI